MSRRHKKPWVKRPYVPKPCLLTKSRTQDVELWTHVPAHSIASNCYGLLWNSAVQYTDSNMATTGEILNQECSSKYIETQERVWDGELIDFSYPRFKAVEHKKSTLHHQQGIEFVHRSYGGWYGNMACYADYTFHGGPYMPDRLPISIWRASQLGYCLTPDEIVADIAPRVAPLIKQKLLTDNSMLNFREAFSVLTFIAELADLRSLPSLLTKWTKTSHDISDKYLGVSFGVLPFYSDIKAILDRLNNLGPAIDEWNAAAQEANTRAYHITIPVVCKGEQVAPGVWENTHAFETEAGYRPPFPVGAYTTTIQTVKARAHIYVIPRAIPSHLIDELKRNIWGVDKILGTVWEKIPFSFVVDWFLKIGNIIEEFEKAEPLLQYRILSAGYSVKVDTVVTHVQSRDPDSADFGSWTLHDTFFKRVPIPTADLLSIGKTYDLGFHTIDTQQALLGTALLHQLLR